METMYKVTQFTTDSLASDLSVLCSVSNGKPTISKLKMSDLISYVKCTAIRFPHTHRKTKIVELTPYHLIVKNDDIPMIEIIESELFEIPTLRNNLNQ